MSNKQTIKNLDELPGLGQKLLSNYPPPTIFLLHGHLGAGKTTFIQSLGSLLNIKERLTSPTFNLMNEYHVVWKEQKIKVIHMDCFRMKVDDTAPDIDFIDEQNLPFYAFIEWPEKMRVDWREWGVPVISIDISIPDDDAVDNVSSTQRLIVWNEK